MREEDDEFEVEEVIVQLLEAEPGVGDVGSTVVVEKVDSIRTSKPWGGNLVDMVRCRRFIDIIEEDDLAASITTQGERTVAGLRDIARDTSAFGNVRGVGSLIAFTFEDAARRDAMRQALFELQVLALGCGTASIRFRLPLVIGAEEVDTLLERTREAAASL